MSSMVAPDTDQLYARATSGDAEAQFQLGRQYAGKRNMARARRWFRDAGERGHAGALTELGLLELFGIGTVPDLETATRYLLAAEERGSGEAAYQLALIAWCDSVVPWDLQHMQQRLLFAARSGHAPALRALALVYARGAGELARFAEPCLRHAAVLGDAISAYLLARRLLAADVRANRAEAAYWFGLAHAAGLTRVAALHGDDLADPIVPPAPQPLPSLPQPLLDVAASNERTLWSEQPYVETIDDVFGAEECEYVIALGAPYLKESVTIDNDRPTLTRSDYRTSSDMCFYSFQEDFALRWLQWRMVRFTGASLAQSEHATLLRYLPGEQYRPHRDYLPPSAPGNTDAPDMPGQRVNTVFCYLNDVDEGGETEFPLQGIRVTPRKGRAVFFKNLMADGTPDAGTLHAGLPVIRGEKWLATIWTRERRYRKY